MKAFGHIRIAGWPSPPWSPQVHSAARRWHSPAVPAATATRVSPRRRTPTGSARRSPARGFNVLSRPRRRLGRRRRSRPGRERQRRVAPGGLQRLPRLAGIDLYYELALPGKHPTYRQLATNLPRARPPSRGARDAQAPEHVARVAERHCRVAADLPARQPRPLVADRDRRELGRGTAGTCNGFLYRFHRVSIAHLSRAAAAPARGRLPDQQPSTPPRAEQRKGGSFLAAEGDLALRTLALVHTRNRDRRAERREPLERAAVVFDTRTQPCETACPRS